MKHRPRILGNLWLLLWLLGVAALAQGAEVSVRTDRNPVRLDESFQIVFDVQGDFSGTPDFSPLEKDFQVLGTSRSLRTTFINGRMERHNEYLVSAMARRPGKVVIPSIAFGAAKSPPMTLEVLPADPAKGAQADVLVEAALDDTSPYVQQQVILTVRILHRIEWREASLSEPQFRGGEVLVQKLGDDRNYQIRRNGQRWNVIERRYALFPQASGNLEMNPLVLTMQVPDGRRSARQRSPFGDPFFDDFFSRQSYKRKVVRSQALRLRVKPIPAAFDGEHWLPAHRVELKEQWSAPLDGLKQGEPVTRTITLSAEGASLGQLPDLVIPQVPGLRIYPDDAKTRETLGDKGVLSILTRKFALIPTQAGTLEVPELVIKWWNLEEDRQAEVRLPAHRLQVVAGPSAQPPRAQATPVPGQSPAAEGAATKATVPPAPGPVQEGREWNRWLLVSNGVLLLLWLITLIAWWRRRPSNPASTPATPPPSQAPKPDWQALHQAARGGDPAALRAAVLAVAAALWPDDPPLGLEGLAARVDGPLANALRRLDEALYGRADASWDGPAIEEGLRRLAEPKPKAKGEGQGALKPLYPSSEVRNRRMG